MRAHCEVFSRIRIPVGANEATVPVEDAAVAQVDGVIPEAAFGHQYPAMSPTLRLVILYKYCLTGLELWQRLGRPVVDFLSSLSDTFNGLVNLWSLWTRRWR